MKPADKVSVIDCRGSGVDERLSIMALQGLINQESAEVYMLFDQHHQEQLDFTSKEQQLLKKEEGPFPAIRALFGKYRDRVHKINIYDPKQDWTFYLALMDGAQNGGIPATKEIKDKLVAESDWNGEVEDFQHRWKTKFEAYDWAIENLLPKTTEKVVMVGNYHIRMFDYAVASKAFVFWLSFKKENNEIDQINKILEASDYTVGTTLLGYADNGDAANSVVNKFGVGYITSDFYANGSFWSSFPNKAYSQRKGKAVQAERGKIYVSLMWSDGDNLQFDQNMLFHAWKDPARGYVPVGTALSPALQELNTPLMDYYYNKKTANDELMAGPCGFQFIYTVHYKKELYRKWLEINTEWVRDGGFNTGSLWWTTYPTPEYDLYTQTTELEGLFHNFNNIGNLPIFSNGVGVFREYITECRTTDCLYRDLANVASNPNHPEFRSQKLIQPRFLPNGFAMLKGVVERLHKDFPGKYVFLLPSDFVATARKYYEPWKNIRRITFKADDSQTEIQHVERDKGSVSKDQSRSSEGKSFWTYKFDLADDVVDANITLDIAGEFLIKASPDNFRWMNVLHSTGREKRSSRKINLAQQLKDNSDKRVFIKFLDRTPDSGGGVSLWQLSLDTASP